jgi:hypothetical protein
LGRSFISFITLDIRGDGDVHGPYEPESGLRAGLCAGGVPRAGQHQRVARDAVLVQPAKGFDLAHHV